MQIKEILNDDRAVSPVIGVILMVAITVILAAVIGTFVLGLGDQVSQTTPSSSFQFNYDRVDGGEDTLTIAHNGGDTLTASEVRVAISGAASNGSVTDSNINSQHDFANLSTIGTNGEISAGTTATINQDNLEGTQSVTNTFDSNETLDLSGATVRVVWQAAEGDSSAQLGTWSGPDA
jgi:flagellin-like protein